MSVVVLEKLHEPAVKATPSVAAFIEKWRPAIACIGHASTPFINSMKRFSISLISWAMTWGLRGGL